ncbi:MAG: DUF58 domain-containing protein [Candidatus Korobacteraceae bacterium]
MRAGSLQQASTRAGGVKYGWLPFAAGRRLFALLCAGLLFVPLMFVSSSFGWVLLAWNGLVALLYSADLLRLPAAGKLSIERSLGGALNQLQPSYVTLTIANASGSVLHCSLIDDVPQSLAPLPAESSVNLPANGAASLRYEICPSQRGDSAFGRAYVRYESGLRIAQRWAAFELEGSVRVYPALEKGRQQAVLLRSRQMELQRRTARQRGHGREFESLREFQPGDERRDICWTATARRSKLVTTLRQSERSQTVWAVIDCGRLMRARLDGRSKLDYAAESAIRLAQLANYGGDSAAMLAYGQRIQQRRLPGKGNQHLHEMLDQLALLQEESGEADHLHAAGTLLSIQKRRAMIVWITDLADLAITPEVVAAALQASNRHLVVVAVLGQPDMMRIIDTAPATAGQTFLYAAASETIRRRELTLARLRRGGVHAIEVNAPQLTGAVLNKYLEVKQKNLL